MALVPDKRRTSGGGGSGDQTSSGALKLCAYCQPPSGLTLGCVSSITQSDLLNQLLYVNIQPETNKLTTKSDFALRPLIWECPDEKHLATHMDRMQEEAVHHYATKLPVLSLCLHVGREA